MLSGIYRHNKGGLYNVLGLAHDANDAGRTAVVYFPLELKVDQLGPRLAVRTLQDFEFAHMHKEEVGWRECAPGCGNEGGHVPRFAYQGPELTRDIIKRRSEYLGAFYADR